MSSTPRPPLPRSKPPTLRLEKRLLREGHTLLAACDEVGRGALGGPATVGVVLIDATISRPLPGLRDSKLLLPAARQRLAPRIRRWVLESAVGHASAAEVDEIGILPALRLAAARGLAALEARPDVILLDGNHDYLTPGGRKRATNQPSLFDENEVPELSFPRVVTQVKGDLTCSAVAAASILAKTERDAIMVQMAGRYPQYGWDENKGYATPEHFAALRAHGPCEQHRQSWRLPAQLLDDEESLIELAAVPTTYADVVVELADLAYDLASPVDDPDESAAGSWSGARAGDAVGDDDTGWGPVRVQESA